VRAIHKYRDKKFNYAVSGCVAWEGKVYRVAHTEMTRRITVEFFGFQSASPQSHKRLKVLHIWDIQFDPTRGPPHCYHFIYGRKSGKPHALTKTRPARNIVFMLHLRLIKAAKKRNEQRHDITISTSFDSCYLGSFYLRFW